MQEVRTQPVDPGALLAHSTRSPRFRALQPAVPVLIGVEGGRAHRGLLAKYRSDSQMCSAKLCSQLPIELSNVGDVAVRMKKLLGLEQNFASSIVVFLVFGG